MPGNNRHYDHRLLPFARELRRGMTDQERHLWYGYLRRSPVRFRRQVPVGPYIADFCCQRARLIVELDGTQHFTEEALEYDHRRTTFLEAEGYRVLRYRNAIVDECIDRVWLQIEGIVMERMKAHAASGAKRRPPP